MLAVYFCVCFFGLHWFYLRAWFGARAADVFSSEAPLSGKVPLWETQVSDQKKIYVDNGYSSP